MNPTTSAGDRTDVSSPQAPLRERVEALQWYHTFDLPGGVVTTGLFDHRRLVDKLPLPSSTAGLRCLDVASSDGFFAFEMARRGATDVVSLDLPDHTAQDFQGAPSDDPSRAVGSGRANQCFALVREATGLDVTRVDGSVYDIASMGFEPFDLVFMGNILLHLRDPVLALQQVRLVTGGRLCSFEAISMAQTLLRPFTPSAQFGLGDANRWWTPNLRGHREMVRAGGFELLETGGPMRQPLGAAWPRRPSRHNLPRTPREVAYWAFTRSLGGAAAWVVARPS